MKDQAGICQRCDRPIYDYFEIPLCDPCLDAVIKQKKRLNEPIDHIIIGEGDGINDIGPGCDGAMG